MCRVVFWLLALGLLYYCYKNAKKSDDYLLYLPLGNLPIADSEKSLNIE